MSESEGDKKRNKLGYQRISVACGHCRRRKIRCVVAEDDAQHRCQNCIRLKKECIYYAVDQPPPFDKNTSTSSNKTGGGTSLPSSAISSSPSDPSPGRVFEQSHQFSTLPSVPSNAPQGYSGLPLDTGNAFQGQASLGPVEYGFHPQELITRQWSGPSDLSPQTQAAMAGPVGGSQSPFWPTSPTGDLEASYHSTQTTHPLPSDGRSFPFPGPEDAQWHGYQQQQHQQQQQQQQARSMSYGSLDAMPTSYMQHNTNYAALPPQQLGGSSYAPPQLDMRSAAALQGMPGPHSAPVNGPPFAAGQQFVYQHNVPGSGSIPAQGGQMGGQVGAWYQDSSSPAYPQYGRGSAEQEASRRQRR